MPGHPLGTLLLSKYYSTDSSFITTGDMVPLWSDHALEEVHQHHPLGFESLVLDDGIAYHRDLLNFTMIPRRVPVPLQHLSLAPLVHSKSRRERGSIRSTAVEAESRPMGEHLPGILPKQSGRKMENGTFSSLRGGRRGSLMENLPL